MVVANQRLELILIQVAYWTRSLLPETGLLCEIHNESHKLEIKPENHSGRPLLPTISYCLAFDWAT